MTDVVTSTLLPPPIISSVLGALQGLPGPPGTSGVAAPTLTFSYGDATPEFITRVSAGVRPFDLRLSIETAFNGIGSALSVGILADHNLLAPQALIDPAVVAVFEFAPQIVFLVDTDVYLFITPGSGASAGNGSVILQRQ